jgi:hypothetical protein
MIRLGSAAGYLFEGPRLLGGWTPPSRPAVYVIMYRLEPSSRYAVIYADHADDLAAAGFPFRHPRSACWTARAGGKWKAHVAWFEVPGGGRLHREQIANELVSVYSPHCNTQKYDPSWRPEWIGEYEARTTSPLTTPKNPSE